MKNIVAKAFMTIDAPASKVWEAMTSPDTIKEYLDGIEVHTDWKAGSPIMVTANMNGTRYELKGIVLHNEPRKLLQYTSWNSQSDTADEPENYEPVCFELYEEEKKTTTLMITQENLQNESRREQAERNWTGIIMNLKHFVEGQAISTM
jgi:uncharacterized protein YndB with AHSA1/START domain